jgi:riboflavin biosynthesis pyrimidine reductase
LTNVDFRTFAAQKTREAATAGIERLATVFQQRVHAVGIGNTWSRSHYGGEFELVAPDPGRTAVSLVFVQTKDGNTGGADPGSLGGGPTDKHLLYEGLSRVAADAVLAGAGSLHPDAFFSVWHPELVTLRQSLGLPRHPAQIVVSRRGRFDIDALLFNVPDEPVFLLAGDECVGRHESALRARPWIRVLRSSVDDLRPAVDQLRLAYGIHRISAVGGRRTATRLVDSGLARDIYLTTTSHDGGDPGTPWYSGASPPRLTLITEKEWHDRGSRVVFDHFLVG